MKKCIKALILATAILSLPYSVLANENFSKPSFDSSAITTDEGMTDDFTYIFEDGNVDATPSDILLMVNGEFVPFTGIIKNNTTFVPIRVVSENFGKEVAWVDKTKEVIIDNITLRVDSTTATVGDKTVKLSYAPFIKDGFTYVPLRFIAENLNKQVGYVSKYNKNVQLNNSIVWIEDKALMNNDGKTEKQVKTWLQEQLNVNKNFFDEHGNSEAFTSESIKNMTFIGQLGRYAVFNSTEPILVDMKNKTVYFYRKGNGYSGIFIQIEDGKYYIYEADVTIDLPDEFDGKYIIGSVQDEYIDDRGGLGFSVYHKASNEKFNEKDGGFLFAVKAWNKDYSSKNPPIMAGWSYDLFSTKDVNYMMQFPSDYRGYEADKAISSEYNILSSIANEQVDTMRDNIKPIIAEIIPLDYPHKSTDDFFFGTWQVSKFLGFGKSYNDDSEQPNGFDIVGNTVVIGKDNFSTSFTKYPQYQYDIESPYYEGNHFYYNVNNLSEAIGVDLGTYNEDSEAVRVYVAPNYYSPNLETTFYVIDDARLIMQVGDKSYYELARISKPNTNYQDTRGIIYPQSWDASPDMDRRELSDDTKEFIMGKWKVSELAGFSIHTNDDAEYPTGPDIIGKEITISENLFSTMDFTGYEKFQYEYNKPVYTNDAVFYDELSFFNYNYLELPNIKSNDIIKSISVSSDGTPYSSTVSFLSIYNNRLIMCLGGGVAYELTPVK